MSNSFHPRRAKGAFDEGRTVTESPDVGGCHAVEERREARDTPLAGTRHDTTPSSGGVQAMNASVVLVERAIDKPIGLRRLNDPRHRRRAYLLGSRKLPKRSRAA